MNALKKVMAGVLGMFVGSYAMANSNALEVYCHNDGLAFQETVTVGSGTRVHFNQGSYSYVVDPLPIEPSFDYIQQQLSRVGGVNAECAEFLMTKGDKALSNDGVMARVHFAFDSSELTKQSRYILDTLLERLQYSNKVIVEGHTDSVGEKKYNFTLGAKRAVAVADYMSQHPHTPYNLIKVSKGETDPVADNNTEDGRYLNRRVDIKQ